MRRHLNLAAAVLLGLGTIVSGSPSRADTATAAITAAQVGAGVRSRRGLFKPVTPPSAVVMNEGQFLANPHDLCRVAMSRTTRSCQPPARERSISPTKAEIVRGSQHADGPLYRHDVAFGDVHLRVILRRGRIRPCHMGVTN
jgi:hypothetical protein